MEQQIEAVFRTLSLTQMKLKALTVPNFLMMLIKAIALKAQQLYHYKRRVHETIFDDAKVDVARRDLDQNKVVQLRLDTPGDLAAHARWVSSSRIRINRYQLVKVKSRILTDRPQEVHRLLSRLVSMTWIADRVCKTAPLNSMRLWESSQSRGREKALHMRVIIHSSVSATTTEYNSMSIRVQLDKSPSKSASPSKQRNSGANEDLDHAALDKNWWRKRREEAWWRREARKKKRLQKKWDAKDPEYQSTNGTLDLNLKMNDDIIAHGSRNAVIPSVLSSSMHITQAQLEELRKKDPHSPIVIAHTPSKQSPPGWVDKWKPQISGKRIRFGGETTGSPGKSPIKAETDDVY